jgi:hypothetical protein
MSRCIDHPISWLRLEQFRLGELGLTVERSVRKHLMVCRACAGSLESIETDGRILRPLGEIPSPSRRPLWIAGFGLAASAAAIFFALMLPTLTSGPEEPGVNAPGKGGALAMILIRKRGDAVLEHPTQYKQGDRFRVEVTSPFQGPAPVEIVIFQDGQAHFPFPPGIEIQAGNRVPVPGAFYLTGRTPATVCIVAGETDLSRADLAHGSAEDLPAHRSVCTMLDSAE